MLKEVNTIKSTIKDEIIKLKHYIGDSSFFHTLEMGKVNEFEIDPDVPLLCKLYLPRDALSEKES